VSSDLRAARTPSASSTGSLLAAPVRVLRLLAVAWWLQLKLRSRSAFDGILSVLWPIPFATSVFLMYGDRATGDGTAAGPALVTAGLVSAALGSAVMGVWSATSTTAGSLLQQERRQGTLELLVAAPRPFPLLVVPLTLSMATIGLYSLVGTLLWGRFVFGIPIPIAHPAGFALGVLATVVSIAMLGFLLAVCSVRYRAAWALGNAFEQPVWLVCGFLVPLALLPAWVRPISWVLAPTWGMAAVRDASASGPLLRDVGLCLALGLVYAGIGAVLSRRLLDSARRHASLALQ
jgi:ABC-2 type transport system permease protein